VVQIFGRDCSFWQYKVCADLRAGSLGKRCQETVGRFMRYHSSGTSFLGFLKQLRKLNTGRPIL